MDEDAENQALSEETAAELREMDTAGLTSYIESHHHEFLREKLPVLGKMAEQFLEHEKAGPLWLLTRNLEIRVDHHLTTEEDTFFRLAERITDAVRRGEDGASRSWVASVIDHLEYEHRKIRQLIGEATELLGALNEEDIPGVRAFRDELKEIEGDLQKHTWIEENILFPRVRRMTGTAEEST